MSRIMFRRNAALTPLAWPIVAAGFCWGLLMRHQCTLVPHRRGVWLCLAWPVKRLWAGQCWVYRHPVWYFVELCVWYSMAVGVAALWILSPMPDISTPMMPLLSTTPLDPTRRPPTTQIRDEMGFTEIAGAGRLMWQLGDTEAVVWNNDTDALECSTTPRMYGAGHLPLTHQGQALRVPAETFVQGLYCRGLFATRAGTPGVRLGPAPPPSPGDTGTVHGTHRQPASYPPPGVITGGEKLTRDGAAPGDTGAKTLTLPSTVPPGSCLRVTGSGTIEAASCAEGQ